MRRIDTAVRNIHYHCLEYDHEQAGELFLVACGMENCDPGVCYGPDQRDCYHLHIVREGSGVLYAGSNGFNEFRVGKNQMFLLKHNETVKYTADKDNPWQYCWVTFNGSEAAALIEEIGFTDGVYCLNLSSDPQLFYDLILRMHQKPEISYVNDLYRRGILLEFLALAMEGCTDYAQSRQKYAGKPIDIYVRQAVDFINYNYATINVSDVIRFIGFSRGYFTTEFHKKTGLSIQDYLTSVRIRRAKMLLENPRITIGEAAAKAGYEDPLNFSKVFRKNTGMSPSAYREELEKTKHVK